MGLREKVALTIAISVITQLLYIHCMPQSHFNFAPNTKHIKSSESCDKERPNNIKTPIREAPSCAAINDSVAIRFPEVEYPSSSQAGEYYRFQNDYPSEFPPTYMNSAPQACNYKRESECKRKYAASSKSKSKLTSSSTTIIEHDPLSEPHCISKGLFPEVDYPLSARDLWLPKQRSRNEAKINGLIETDVTESKGATKGKFSNDPSDDHLNLTTLIKALNTVKKSSLETVKGDNISPTSITPNTDINSEILISKKEPSVYIVIIKPSTENGHMNDLGIPEENQGSQENIIPVTSTPTNTDVHNISLKNSLSYSATSTILPIIKESSDIYSELIIPETSQTSHEEIIPESSKKDLLNKHDNNVTTTTNSDTSDNISLLIVPEKNQGFVGNIVTTTTSEASCNIIPELSKVSSLNEYSQKTIMKTNSDASGNISQPSIPKEYESSCDNFALNPTIATHSNIIPAPYIKSSLQDCGNIVKTTTNTGPSDIISQPHQEKQGSNANIISKITNVSKNDFIPETVETNSLSNSGDIVTTMTNNSHISQLFTPEDNQCSLDDTILTITTDASCNNTSESVTINDGGDIFTMRFDEDIVSELSISNENENSSNNIIAKAEDVTCRDIIPETHKTSSLCDCGDTDTTTTGTDNTNTSQLRNTNNDQGPLENIVSTNTTGSDSGIIYLPFSVTTCPNSAPCTPSASTCSGNHMAQKTNNDFDSLEAAGKDVSQNKVEFEKNNLTVKDKATYMPSNTDTNENNNPQELPYNTQNIFSLLNTNTNGKNENLDTKSPVILSCSNTSTKAVNEQSRENSNNAVIVTDMIPTVAASADADDCWLLRYDVENSTQDVPDYESVYFMTKKIANLGAVSVVDDAVDLIMCVQDANCTLQ